MKIAMVSPQVDPVTGTDASSTHLTELSCELARHRHSVTLYVRQTDPELRGRVRLAPGVTVDRIPAGPARRLDPAELGAHVQAFQQGLADRWAAAPPDVVHAYSWAGGLAALAGAGGLPVVQSHDLPEPSALGPQQLRLERAIGRSARSVIAACAAEREELVRLGVARPRIHIVPEGVDFGRFGPKGPSYPRGDRARLLMLSLHGVETAISALPRIPKAELVVAGGPPCEDLEADPEVHRLRILAKELGVGDRVVFLGRITRPNVPSLVRSADLVLALPQHDLYGTIALEAMACGIPVVATAVGGNLDTVVDGVTGLLVPPGHARALAIKVRTLLDDPVRQVAYGIAGADRAVSRHTWERVAAETVRTYERALLPA